MSDELAPPTSTVPKAQAAIVREFGKRLKAARIAEGFQSAALFAFALGVEEHTYRHWERGAHAPDLDTLQRICLILRVSANELLPGPWNDESDASLGL